MVEHLFLNAREELMKRVEYRDSHLQHCLIALVVVFALGEGIEVAGVKGDSAKIAIYLFSYPVSLLFMSLYLKEENLIGNLSNYLEDLSKRANRGKKDEEIFPFWDDSPFLKRRLKVSMNYRVLSTLITFVIFPGMLVGSYFFREGFEQSGSFILFFGSCVIAIVMTIWQLREYRRRT